MNYKIEQVKAPGRDQVELLGETYEKGRPEGEEAEDGGRRKAGKSYFYGKDGYGSERRKKLGMMGEMFDGN